jgi:hypothetical protein
MRSGSPLLAVRRPLSAPSYAADEPRAGASLLSSLLSATGARPSAPGRRRSAGAAGAIANMNDVRPSSAGTERLGALEFAPQSCEVRAGGGSCAGTRPPRSPEAPEPLQSTEQELCACYGRSWSLSSLVRCTSSIRGCPLARQTCAAVRGSVLRLTCSESTRRAQALPLAQRGHEGLTAGERSSMVRRSIIAPRAAAGHSLTDLPPWKRASARNPLSARAVARSTALRGLGGRVRSGCG